MTFEFVPDRTAITLEETRRDGWDLAEFARRMHERSASEGVGAVRASIDVSRVAEAT
ncbi:MAG: hypothetical protein ABIP93_08940 [Gemmatimonadaceae bacterium]